MYEHYRTLAGELELLVLPSPSDHDREELDGIPGYEFSGNPDGLVYPFGMWISP